MADRDKQIITYVSQDEKVQIQEWADECGKSVSELARDAIMEYVDHDRTARIEEKVDRALTLLEDSEHTHTQGGNGQLSVPEKARKIAKRCYSNHDMPMQGTDVEIAIEDMAGGDDRTISKYKEQLKKRGLLYQHPMQPVWTDSKRQWVGWVENATVAKDVYGRADEYGMDTDEYDQIAQEVTQ